MSETTIQSETVTTNPAGTRYSRAQARHSAPSPESLSQAPETPAQGYVRAHRATDNSVVVNYNSAEAHARAVRRQISRLLND